MLHIHFLWLVLLNIPGFAVNVGCNSSANVMPATAHKAVYFQVVGAVGFQGKQLVVPNDGDPLLSRICSDCLSQNPDLRPSFPVILTLLEEALGNSGPSSFTTSLADANLNGLGHPQDFSRDKGVAGRVLDTELRSKHNAGLVCTQSPYSLCPDFYQALLIG